jgi:hypothetical protein
MAGLVPAIYVFAEAIDESPRFLPKIGANHVGGLTAPPPNSC